MTNEVWISVDVETSGPTPSTGSLIAVGACRVDNPRVAFSVEIRPVEGLPWLATAEKIHGLTRERLAVTGVEPEEAMRAFERWLTEACEGGRPVFVAFNAPFDWMFVADCAWRHLGRNPFGHAALDIKALYLGRHLGDVRRWGDTSREHVLRRYPVDLPHTHNALDDAREQALILSRMLDAAGA